MRRSTLFYKNKDVGDEEDDDEDEEEDDDEDEEQDEEENIIKRSRAMNDVAFTSQRKKLGGGINSSSSSTSTNPAAASCQAENCPADMKEAKRYHQRHKVCEYHAKAPMVRVASLWQRFCQQCSRFHELAEFDEAKRSCRRRLAGHNQRRRKSSYDPHGDE